MKQKEQFFMAGTEGTGAYVVLCVSPSAKVGVRNLGGSVRVRVEPTVPSAKQPKSLSHLSPETGWKQPGDGGQNRFSTVVPVKSLPAVLKTVFKAARVAAKTTKWNTLPNLRQVAQLSGRKVPKRATRTQVLAAITATE